MTTDLLANGVVMELVLPSGGTTYGYGLAVAGKGAPEADQVQHWLFLTGTIDGLRKIIPPRGALRWKPTSHQVWSTKTTVAAFKAEATQEFQQNPGKRMYAIANCRRHQGQTMPPWSPSLFPTLLAKTGGNQIDVGTIRFGEANRVALVQSRWTSTDTSEEAWVLVPGYTPPTGNGYVAEAMSYDDFADMVQNVLWSASHTLVLASVGYTTSVP